MLLTFFVFLTWTWFRVINLRFPGFARLFVAGISPEETLMQTHKKEVQNGADHTETDQRI